MIAKTYLSVSLRSKFAIEAEGVVVMEAENNIYDHTLWALRNASNPGKAPGVSIRQITG